MERLIFDCDGVLVDSEAIAEATLVERLASWLPDVDIQSRLGEALGLTTGAILERLERSVVMPCPMMRWVPSTERSNVVWHRSCAHRWRRRRYRTAGHGDGGGIQQPSRAGTRLAGAYWLDALLDGAPIFCAEQVARPKPDPAIYRLAAETLAVSPEECLVVEDSTAGVGAARAAGMTVIGFTGASHVLLARRRGCARPVPGT